MTSEHLSPALESSLAVVRQWLGKITAASTNPDLDLRNFRAVLIHLLEIAGSDHRRRGGQPCRGGLCLQWSVKRRLEYVAWARDVVKG